jgi:hypothetical protein
LENIDQINNTLTNIPLSELITIPIAESYEAQNDLNMQVFNMIDSLVDDDGNFTTVTFKSNVADNEKQLTIPLITLVEPCCLCIKNINASFDVAIQSVTKTTQETSADLGVIRTDTVPSTVSQTRYKLNGKLTGSSSLDVNFKMSVFAEERNKSIGLKKLQEFLADNIATKTVIDYNNSNNVVINMNSTIE